VSTELKSIGVGLKALMESSEDLFSYLKETFSATEAFKYIIVVPKCLRRQNSLAFFMKQVSIIITAPREAIRAKLKVYHN